MAHPDDAPEPGTPPPQDEPRPAPVEPEPRPVSEVEAEPPPRPQYEFTRAQNAMISDLAAKMRFVGLFFMTIGGLVLVLWILQLANPNGYLLGGLVIGTIVLLTGIWTRSAAAEFQKVVETEGADITHLMDALFSLLKLYTLTFWMSVVIILVVVASILLALFPATFA